MGVQTAPKSRSTALIHHNNGKTVKKSPIRKFSSKPVRSTSLAKKAKKHDVINPLKRKSHSMTSISSSMVSKSLDNTLNTKYDAAIPLQSQSSSVAFPLFVRNTSLNTRKTSYSTLYKKLFSHDDHHSMISSQYETPLHISRRTSLSSLPSLHTHHIRSFHSTPRLRVKAPPIDRASLSRGEHTDELTFMQTLHKLTPYIWPKNDNATKIRVSFALSMLFASKIINVGIPLVFKDAVDFLTGDKVLPPHLKKPPQHNPSLLQSLPTPSSPSTTTAAPSFDEIQATYDDFADTMNHAIEQSNTHHHHSTNPVSSIVDAMSSWFADPNHLNLSTGNIPIALLATWGIMRILASFTSEFKNALFTKISNDATRNIAVDLLKHLLHMDVAFHLDRNTGSISRSIDRGNKSISTVLSMITFRIVPTFLEFGLVVSVLYATCGPAYSAVAMATVLSYIVYTIGITQWRIKFRQQMNQHQNKSSSIAFDSLMNIDTVQMYNNQSLESSKYDKSFIDYGNAQTKNESSLALLNWGQQTIFAIGLTSVMILAAQGVQAGTMTAGDLVLVNGLLLQLSAPLNIVGTVYRELKQAVFDMQTMFALRSTVSLIKDVEHPTKINPKTGEMIPYNDKQSTVSSSLSTETSATLSSPDSSSSSEHITPHTTIPQHDAPGLGFTLKDVTFAYASNKDRVIVKNLSLTMKPGTSTALVGGSGCGKSTVLKLAARLFDPLQGEIKVNNVPLPQVELASLRSSIGLVPQDTTLFNDSIMYNIRYARPDAADDEVIEAAKLAQLHDSITSMTKGYDTLVGERGLKLSGGEKQRISIARMMLLNPPAVFCDEATSALDSTTEHDIMSNLRRLTKDKTCLYVAHRLSTITHCDNIVVLKEGSVAEQGTHKELLQIPNGIYQHMWNLQSTANEGRWDALLPTTTAAVAAVAAADSITNTQQQKH